MSAAAADKRLTDLLFDLFDEGEEIRIELADGSEFISADVEAVVKACADDPDPWLDLVNQNGEAHGQSVPGDPTVVDPAPSCLIDGGMLYLLDVGEVIPNEPFGKHMLPVSLIGTINTDAFYRLDDLAITTPAREMDIILSSGRNRQEYQGKWKPMKSVFGQFAEALTTHTEGKKDGACFLQGECAGGVRKAAAMVANYVIGIDLDSGAPLDDVMNAIIGAGLDAVIYTTHSHLKDTSQIKRDHFLKWADGADVTPELCAEYLQAKKGVLPHIVERIEILNDSLHTEEGVVILVKHNPMPKFRAVFPLHEPFVFARRGGTQQDAIAEWKERYAGFATQMGFFFDETCIDPARLFYLPRHKKGDVYDTRWIVGNPVNLDTCDRVKIRRDRNGVKRAVASNAFTELAGDACEDNDPDRYMAGDFNLVAWAKKNAKLFEIETFMSDHTPDVLREPRGSGKGGVHVECPFEAEHSSFGGGGSFIVNSGDAYDEGYDSGFTFKCVHAACQGRDRLDFLKGCIEDGWFEAEALNDKRYMLEIEEEEEPAKASVAKAELKSSTAISCSMGKSARWEAAGEEERKLLDFNERYAVVVNGDKVRILREPDSVEDDVKFYTQTDIKLLEAPNLIYQQGKNGKTEVIPTMKVWETWEERRTYTRVVFSPGNPVPANTYNLFRGFAVQPVQGDWSILKGHLFENICESNDEYFEYVFGWLAQMIQHPEKKPGSSIAIVGKKGVGKSTVSRYVRALVGAHSLSVANQDQMFSNFNEIMGTTIFLVAEEAFWAANPKIEGILKDLITGDTVVIEKKGYDKFESRSFIRLMQMSNNINQAVPASCDERRFGVFECSDVHKGDTDYFDAMEDQMLNRGGLQAMMYDLVNFVPKTGNFNYLFNPPKTIHLRKQVVSSLHGPEKFLYDLVTYGFYEPSDGDIDTIELKEDDYTEIEGLEFKRAIQDFVKNKFASDKAKVDVDLIKEITADWCNAIQFKAKSGNGTNAKLWLRFPPLSEIRDLILERKDMVIEPMSFERKR